MRITNIHGADVYLPTLGLSVGAGDTVDVPDESEGLLTTGYFEQVDGPDEGTADTGHDGFVHRTVGSVTDTAADAAASTPTTPALPSINV